MLALEGVDAFYGRSQVLFGINLTIAQGQIVTLLGRNGMGKSTAVKAITGIVPARRGSIIFEGMAIHRLQAFQIARLGIGLVPEGRHIFPNLTVRENIVAVARSADDTGNPWTLEKVLTLFPRLRERLDHWGDQLSGGEQQMLAISRALVTNPKLLVLDEATEGLAPLARREIWRCLDLLRSMRQSILVIDKNLEPLLRIADFNYILEKGHVVWKGSSAELRANDKVRDHYLGV
jgi:branched-chain amino acid transport system ATP-binding protein